MKDATDFQEVKEILGRICAEHFDPASLTAEDMQEYDAVFDKAFQALGLTEFSCDGAGQLQTR